jgi:two-component system phosphate regulon response regulator OmpR
MTAVRPHILVVDDDPLMRELINDYLLESDFRVSAAGCGADMDRVLEGEVGRSRPPGPAPEW